MLYLAALRVLCKPKKCELPQKTKKYVLLAYIRRDISFKNELLKPPYSDIEKRIS